MELFKVTAWFDHEYKTNTFENFVIAKNESDAKRMVNEEIWTLYGMEIKCVEKIDMSVPQILCSINTEDIE